MNLTVLGCAMYTSFIACMGVAAWLASKQVDGWGWIIFATIIVFGGINMKSGPDTITCPKCGEVIKTQTGD
jgi:intracellular septation protein A